MQVAVSIIGIEQNVNLWEQMFASSTLAMLVPVLLDPTLSSDITSAAFSAPGLKG